MDLLNLIAERGAKSHGVEMVVDDQATKLVLEQVEHQKRSKRITVRNKLSPQEADAFRARYGGAYELKLTQEYEAPHSLAGALRIAEHYDCLGQFPLEDPVIDFGGSWWHHYSREDYRVHSCCPILGVRDAARHEERLCRMRKLLEVKDMDQAPNFCLNKAEECKVQADWAICIHGGYDMGFKKLCEAMNVHGVRILRGTIMFDGAMLFDKQGTIPLLNCRWMREGSGSSEVIKFDFVNESTLSYVHNWRNLGSFLTESVCYVGGTTYLLEREVLRCGIMSYKIIATNVRCPPETLRHCVWFENISQYVAVNVPEDWSFANWKKVRVAVSTVREVEEIAFRCFKENKDWAENMKAVASVLSAKSSTVIINGQAIMAGERLDILDYHLVAFSLTMNLYQKYERLRDYRDELEWKGWVNHFKSRLWSGGKGVGGVSFIRGYLMDKFPRLKLDTYMDTLMFITKISDVKEFECDSVPISRIRAFLSGEDDIYNRAIGEFSKALDKKSSKVVEREQEDEFVDASEELKTSGPVVVDDKKEPQAPTTECNLDPKVVARGGAISEFAEYCDRQHLNTTSNLHQLWTLTGCKGDQINNKSVVDTYHRIDDLVNVHLPSGRWMYPHEYEYVVGYNDNGLGAKFENELYIVDKTCIVSNQKKLAVACKNLNVPTCPVYMVDGVAGCGKTTAIKNTFQFERDVVVTANRKSADDVRAAIFPENPNNDVAIQYIRTADSAIMHGLPKCRRLLIDEAGLMHFGQLMAVAAISGCEEVVAFGDTEQISFKSRDVTFRMRHNAIKYDSRELVKTTFRCPQDVVGAVKLLKRKCGNRDSKYNDWVSESKVSKSLSKRSISSPTQINIEKGKFYLTMTQSDKAALQTRAKDFDLTKEWIENNIKTVHEAQGISVDNVVLVRLKSTKCDLFKHEEYCLVAITRHKRSFEYCYNGKMSGDLIDACVI